MFKKQKQLPEVRRVVRMQSQRPYSPYATSSRTENGNRPSSESSRVRRRPDEQDRGQAQEDRGSKLKKIVLRRRLLLAGAATIVALGVSSLLYLSSSPDVVIAQTGDTQPILLHSKDEYQAAAQNLLQKSLANYNKITVDKNAIEQSLQEQFPELSSVLVRIPFVGTRPTVLVTPREPVAVLQTASGALFVIDGGGTAIKSGQAPAGMDLPTVVDQTGSPAVLGKQVLPSTTIDLIELLLYQLAQKKIEIESFILPSSSAQEVDLRVAGSPYYIKFSTADPSTYREQVGSYLALREYLAGKGITPKEYVDVRLPGRAYYK